MDVKTRMLLIIGPSPLKCIVKSHVSCCLFTWQHIVYKGAASDLITNEMNM